MGLQLDHVNVAVLIRDDLFQCSHRHYTTVLQDFPALMNVEFQDFQAEAKGFFEEIPDQN